MKETETYIYVIDTYELEMWNDISSFESDHLLTEEEEEDALSNERDIQAWNANSEEERAWARTVPMRVRRLH